MEQHHSADEQRQHKGHQIKGAMQAIHLTLLNSVFPNTLPVRRGIHQAIYHALKSRSHSIPNWHREQEVERRDQTWGMQRKPARRDCGSEEDSASQYYAGR